MNSYEYLLKTAALPAPLRQDPDLDDVVTWDTPGGHTDLAERGRVPVSALYGLSSQDRAAAAQRALARAQHEELQGLRDDMWHRDMRDQWAKHSNEDTGYSTAAPTSTTPRRTGIGAPALPPTPSAAPTTMAPPPSPKLGGLLDDIESTLRRRRLAGAAREAAMRQAEVQVRPQLERYQATRNKTLKSLGLHGLGAGLGGLALYGAGRYALERASSPPAEDYAASYG